MISEQASQRLKKVGLSVLALIYAVWGLCDSLTELGGDSAAYMLMGRALSPYTASDPILAQALSGAPYPPLFPAMIGMVGGSFLAAHGVVLAALLLAFGLMFKLLRSWGLAEASAAFAVALFAALPGTYLLALNIWSENPFLACSLLALLLLGSANRSPSNETIRPWWAASLAASAAIMIRTAGFPLLVTATAFVLLRRPRQWGWMLLTAWAPFFAWMGWSHVAGGGSQYGRQLLNQYSHDPLGHLLPQLAAESQSLINAWLADWLGFAAPHALIGLVRIFGLTGLAGCALRLFRGHPEALYVLLYLMMLLVWPWPGEAPRLLYAVIPLLIGYGLLVVEELSMLLTRVGSTLPYGVLALLGIAVFPGVAITVQERLAPVPQGLELIRHVAGYYSDDLRQERRVAWDQAQILADLHNLTTDVPAQECIFQIKSSVIQLVSGRRSLAPPLPSTDDRTFAQQMKQCRYAYLMKLQSPTFPVPFYPGDRLLGQYHVIRQLPDITSNSGEPLAQLVELPVNP